MLTARAHRRAASFCLSLVLFSITPFLTSELCSLKRWGGGVGGQLTVSQTAPLHQGLQLFVLERWHGCAGRDRVERVQAGLEGVMAFVKGGIKGAWRKAAHQYAVMGAWESYCYRNAEITQAGQVYFLSIHSCWKTTGEKLTRLSVSGRSEKL